MKKTHTSYFLILFFCYTHVAWGNTDKFRIMWRDDPSTTMVIAWNQISGSNPVVYFGRIDYGSDFSKYEYNRKPDRIVEYNGMRNHFVRLTGLRPNTAYYFVVRDSEGTSKRLWFRTAPNDEESKISVIAGGDSRDSRIQRQNANKLVGKLRPHVVLFGGDMTRSNLDREWIDWFDDWQLTISSDGKMTPIIVARGNHESSDDILVNHFDVPHKNVYYALTFGKDLLRVYTLNSETSVAGDQTDWLINDLTQNAGVQWKMAQYHKPMRPHTSVKNNQNTLYRYWASVFYEHKVRVVIECDAHTVKSTWPLVPSTATGSHEGFIRDDKNGTVYLGEGCWGAPLRTNDNVKPWTRNSGMFNQFNWIFISREKIEARVIKTDNADEVESLSESDPFRIPARLDIWTPSNGAVITIPADKPEHTGTEIVASIQGGTDDAEERTDGGVYIGSSDLELVYDNSTTGNQTVGIRFVDVKIPKGAMITHAHVQFTAKEHGTESTKLLIQGEAADNSLTFEARTKNVSSRTKTLASVTWEPIPWTTIGQRGPDQRTPELKRIIQEIVDRGGWKENNAITFIITGTGKRTASAFELSPAQAPMLRVFYEMDTTEPPPAPGDDPPVFEDDGKVFSILSGTDDVEQRSDGTIYVNSSDLELTYDNASTGNQTIGLRFSAVDIPKNAMITKAYLRFVADETGAQPTSLVIAGEANDNARTFSYKAYDVSSREKTRAFVNWEPPTWNLVMETGARQVSPDLSNIVKEIVSRPGWTPGNPIAFIISGNGKRTAWAYEGSPAHAPKLVIAYSVDDFVMRESAGPNSANTEKPAQPSPNPFTDKLVLYTDATLPDKRIRYAFYSQGGRLILEGELETDFRGAAEIDTSAIPPGIYVIRYGNGVMRTDKIIRK